ncbi:hypothetical protein DFH09DRAFT_1122274 [Mycena vulgaris]|nr:hypothetical protein DFH09DRAFT_1122274 [Mycena vulgaris]
MALLYTNVELDEFDVIQDPFADADVDWTQLLATPATTQSTQTSRQSSPEYFPDDPLDEVFLAQLDLLDGTSTSGFVGSTPAFHNATTVPQSTIPLSSTGPHPSTSTIQLAGLFPPNRSPSPPPPQARATKRRRTISEDASRSHESPESSSPSKKRKGADVPQAGFEGELSCPICFDILVATHLFNPCGHSFCGDCGWQWITANKKAGCPVCRSPLAGTPMIPNICVDKMVDMHIQILSCSDEDWGANGKRLTEFQGRQKKWKDRLAERNKPVVAKPPPVWVVVSDDSDEDLHGSDEDLEVFSWEESALSAWEGFTD